MYVIFETPTRRFYDAEVMEEPVSVAETGTAQVDADVGERLVERYDTITPKETDS